jgi:hypothetical protein
MESTMNKCVPLCFLVSSLSFASNVQESKITEVLVGERFGSKVFVALEVRPTDAPSCANNSTYSYVFDGSTESGKIKLSVVLAAYAAQKTIKIGGTGICSLYSNVENFDYIGSK